MNTIKKLVVALAVAVPCLLAAPTVPAEPFGIAVETELEAESRRYRTREHPDGLLCIPKPCDSPLCCRIEPF